MQVQTFLQPLLAGLVNTQGIQFGKVKEGIVTDTILNQVTVNTGWVLVNRIVLELLGRDHVHRVSDDQVGVARHTRRRTNNDFTVVHFT